MYAHGHTGSTPAGPSKGAAASSTPKTSEQPLAKPTLTPAATVALWGKLTIPAIHVDSPLEAVGLDVQKRMAVPTRPEDAGWYKLGHKPNEAGNTVIDGHVSLTGGRHGVFYDLAKLKVGDSIVITDNLKKQYYFEVTGSTTYARDAFPLQDVFDGQRAQPLLKLITCESYNPAQKTYSDRRVVTARLKQ